jgi:hypothetical protein
MGTNEDKQGQMETNGNKHGQTGQIVSKWSNRVKLFQTGSHGIKRDHWMWVSGWRQ